MSKSGETRGLVEITQDIFHMEEYIGPDGKLRQIHRSDERSVPKWLLHPIRTHMSNQSNTDQDAGLISYGEARNRVFELLPEYRSYIVELIRLDKQNPAGDHGFIKHSPRDTGWTTDHAALPPQAYTKLLNAGLIRKFKETNSSKYYTTTVDYKTLRDLLDEHDTLEEVEEETQPIEQDVATPSRPESWDELPDDLFDTIIGYDQAKRVFKRAIVGEGQTHIALRGEAGVAKSAFLREVEELDGAYYRTANGMTRAGLTSFVMDTRPTFLLLDELEKTKGGDADPTNVLYNLMEEGIVQTTQSSKGSGEGSQTVEVPCDVYATVNDWHRLPNPIQDRFIDLTFEQYDREEFIEVVIGVLNKFHGAEKGVGRTIAIEVLDTLHERSVRTAEQVYELARGPDDVEATVADIQAYR